jgi:predicted small secreted protein
MNVNLAPLMALLLGFGLLATLPACNTVAGAGRDIGAAGEAIENTAEDVKN